MKKKLALLVLAFLITLSPFLVGATDTVSVTATPTFISFTVTPTTWTMNGITGDSYVTHDTIYYANPLGDTTAPSATVVNGECRFTCNNSSSVATDLSIDQGHFTGGDAMQNSGTGSNGVGTFGGYSYASGDSYPGSRVVMLTTSSAVLENALAASTNIMFGALIETQSDAFASGDQETSTMTANLVADS